jgi:hypothetical protein
VVDGLVQAAAFGNGTGQSQLWRCSRHRQFFLHFYFRLLFPDGRNHAGIIIPGGIGNINFVIDLQTDDVFQMMQLGGIRQ